MSRWFELSADFSTDPKIEALGEEHGPAGPLAIVALAAAADDSGTFRLELGRLGSIVFVETEVAERIVVDARAAGALLETSVSDGLVTGRVSPTVSRIRRRNRIPRWIREAVLQRDGRVCQLCGQPITAGQELHLDHIIPWSRGGSDAADNLQPSHGHCNRSKGARL